MRNVSVSATAHRQSAEAWQRRDPLGPTRVLLAVSQVLAGHSGGSTQRAGYASQPGPLGRQVAGCGRSIP